MGLLGNGIQIRVAAVAARTKGLWCFPIMNEINLMYLALFHGLPSPQQPPHHFLHRLPLARLPQPLAQLPAGYRNRHPIAFLP